MSLPGGVFSSAGAGVKTNLVFFTKGKQTEKIWYYDLSGVKVGKKTPLTLAHFEEFFMLVLGRGRPLPQSARWTPEAEVSRSGGTLLCCTRAASLNSLGAND